MLGDATWTSLLDNLETKGRRIDTESGSYDPQYAVRIGKSAAVKAAAAAGT